MTQFAKTFNRQKKIINPSLKFSKIYLCQTKIFFYLNTHWNTLHNQGKAKILALIVKALLLLMMNDDGQKTKNKKKIY